jgi:hypothetical protein
VTGDAIRLATPLVPVAAVDPRAYLNHMDSKRISVTLSLPGEPSTEAQATLIERNPLARAGRAVAVLFGLWGVAVACVFLPIAHFVLVPSFALAGVVAAIVRGREDRSLEQVEGVCPRCKVSRHFGKAGRFREGKTIHCDGCGSQLEVHSRPQATPPTPLEQTLAAR